MTFRRGLIVGKFAPLHRGHVHLIEQALAAADWGLPLPVAAVPDAPPPVLN